MWSRMGFVVMQGIFKPNMLPLEEKQKSGEKNKVISNEIASIQSSNNKLDNTVHTLSEALSSVDEAVIRGSGIKAYDLIQKKKSYFWF